MTNTITSNCCGRRERRREKRGREEEREEREEGERREGGRREKRGRRMNEDVGRELLQDGGYSYLLPGCMWELVAGFFLGVSVNRTL